MVDMTEDQVIELFERLSNVGRWGPDDELGTVNFITAQKRLEATSLVRSGEVMALAHDASDVKSAKNPVPMVHRMLYSAHEPVSTIDMVQLAPHGWHETHLDATGHIFFEGRQFNGRHAAENVKLDGMDFGSIYAFRDGIVTRGVLLDVARARGVPYLAGGEGIHAKDLDAAEQLSGVRVGSGDCIIVRCGLGQREVVEGPTSPQLMAGVDPDCLAWIHEREVAVYAGDCADKAPSGYERLPIPLHQVGMVAMGLCFLDNTAIEPLAERCASTGVYEFLLVVAPLRLPRATASSVTPLAIF